MIATRASVLSGCAKQLELSESVLVIGGGTVGVELAAEVVEKVRDVGGCLWCVQQWSHVLSFGTRCVI